MPYSQFLIETCFATFLLCVTQRVVNYNSPFSVSIQICISTLYIGVHTSLLALKISVFSKADAIDTQVVNYFVSC